ncbi:PREDICTED: probable aminotransferase TAT2 [Nicotiana attenuata]|uniref:Aminotransferase tat2 n=1 Tax=Nicotiana attenuata TaxID=49451 RepID=A0A1J6IVS9_NICAT|nr:PREDICTED: probable aminotransferase TAT2 [Nicotiana attenuata]XP_019243452.1 PREDICTED: probable aminotransferase TAT2 [Nicotiana attenuata]OIT04696.1 putative aminotransferase tat2 [Nicotiana attenuata]
MEETNEVKVKENLSDGVNNQEIETPNNITIKGILGLLMANVETAEDEDDENGGNFKKNKRKKKVISLGMGDPTAYSCFHSPDVAQNAVIETLASHKFNGYSPTVGLPQTRRAIADYLSRDLPEKLCADDVYVTAGCTQAIEIALSILARPGANILLPRPGFPIYALCAAFRHIEVRYFDLVPDKGWEVDLNAVEALADCNTIGIVVINPGNPCGNVYSYQHLQEIAETAKKLRTIVIADEVYGHLAFGAKPFVSMGVFGAIAPVLTLGSLSKRWLVPGWRLGWLVTNDPNGTFKNPKFVERIKKYCDICGGPATFIQAAVPRIIQQTEEVFFRKTINLLKWTADICCEKIKEIPCISCPHKPEGSMAVMVKLNLLLLTDISDDIDFCFKLAKEESVILLPGLAVGLKNWIRITFAADPSSLEEALGRLKSFCQRHSIQQNGHC